MTENGQATGVVLYIVLPLLAYLGLCLCVLRGNWREASVDESVDDMGMPRPGFDEDTWP